MELKVCPYCGNKEFIAMTKRASLVTVNENNETEIKDEGSEVKDIEVVACATCKKELTKENLILGVKCIKCNRIVNKGEIDDKGVCLLCRIKEDANELSKASKEDLISICKLLLVQEKQQQEQVREDKPKEKKVVKRKKKEPEQVTKQEEDKKQEIKSVVVQEENHIDITENDEPSKDSLDIFEQARENVSNNVINIEDKRNELKDSDTIENLEFPLYEDEEDEKETSKVVEPNNDKNDDFSAF